MFSDKDNRKKTVYILALIVIAASVTIFLASGELSRSPFDRQMSFDMAKDAIINGDGITAIVDSMGSRIFLVSPENEIVSIISYQALSGVSPVEVTAICMDNERLYILDNVMSESGRNVSGERVLAYDLKGNYEATLLSTNELKTDEAAYRITNLSCRDGRVYATVYDELDELFAGVADITGGTFSFIHGFSTGALVAYNIFYQPEKDITTAVAYNGGLMRWDGDEHVAISASALSSDPVDALAVLSDAEILTLSQNTDSITLHNTGSGKRLLAKTGTDRMFVKDNELVFADPQTNTVHIIAIDSGEERVLSVLNLSTKDIILGYFTWGMLILGSAALLLLAAVLIYRLVKKLRNRKDEDGNSEKAMTTAGLYGPVFAVMIPVFAVTALLFGSFFYQEALDNSHAAVINTGFSISKTSSGSLGRDLSAIASQKDFGSEAYRSMMGTVDVMCMNSTPLATKTDLACSLYRFADDLETAMVVLDATDQTRIGTILTPEDQKVLDIYEDFEIVKQGYMSQAFIHYDSGQSYYAIYVPVYDGDGKLTGAALLKSNESYVISRINEKIFTKLLEIFTLLTGLAMLFGEVMFVKDIAGIQKKRRQSGIKNTTVMEASRPIIILTTLPGSVMLVFITLMTSTILKNTGMDGSALLLALPLTVQTIVFSIIKTASMSIANSHPKFFMVLGVIINIISFSMLLISTSVDSYALLMAATVVFGIGNGILNASVNSFRMSGIEPDPKYRLMVFCGMESAIAAAVGISLSAVIRGIWGNTGMMAYLIVIELITIPVVLYFTGTDLSERWQSFVKQGRKQISTVLRADLKFLLNPKIFISVFLASLPLYFMNYFNSYVLPLFNERAGYPECLIGTVTVAVQLVVLFVLPYIVKATSGLKSHQIYIGGFLVTAVSLLLFAVDGSMKTFTPVLLMISICFAVFISCTEVDILVEAGGAGVNVGDTMMVCEFINNLSSYLAMLLLSFMMLPGFDYLGWEWSIICVACAVTIAAIAGATKRCRTADV